jgi:LPXTG-site transpeptidase (sortase) family protein
VAGHASITDTTTAATASVPFRPITKIVIPSIALASEVTPAKLLKRDGSMSWDVPAFVAGHAQTSAGAGEPGNAVLLGHVVSRDAGNVFSHLDRVAVGDLVRVFSHDEYFDYRIVDTREVSRTDTSVLDPTETPSLSLITCAGAWMPFAREYSERLVVRAQLTGQAQGGAGLRTSSDTVDAAARTLFDDVFIDNRNGWRHDAASTTRFADGSYRLTARTPGRFVAVGAPIARVFRDVEVRGDFRKVGGPPGGGYGLIVRRQTPPGDGVDQGGRFYVLEVSDRGEFGVWRREADHWVDLASWTPSEAVRPGNAVNSLHVRATGTELSFAVNGVTVANVADAALADGGVGVFVGGDSNDVAVERFVVRE